MKRILAFALCSIATTACGWPDGNAGMAHPIGNATRDNPARYGATLTTDGVTAVTDVASVTADFDRYSEQSVIVEGDVRSTCTAIGCWIELVQPGEANLKGPRGLRVTFLNSGFLVPIEAGGAHARVQGLVREVQWQPADVEHLHHEGGQTPGVAADGSVTERTVLATGVEMWRD